MSQWAVKNSPTVDSILQPGPFVVADSKHNCNFWRFTMDGGTIFIYLLSATFLGSIAYLAITSRRRNSGIKQEAPWNTEAREQGDQKPRSAA